MAEKRRYRTGQERLTDDILARASNAQLLALFDSKEFEESREKIQKNLQVSQALTLNISKKFTQWMSVS